MRSSSLGMQEILAEGIMTTTNLRRFNRLVRPVLSSISAAVILTGCTLPVLANGAAQVAQTIPTGVGIGKPAIMPGKPVQQVIGFRNAVNSKQLSFKMHGDGV